MADYILTEKAEEDFDGIGLYSLNSWGLSQAESYLRDLDHCFVTLAQDSGLGKDRADIRPELLVYPCKRHNVFFRRHPNGDVEILRIFHERMDFERHL